ncbi:MAG TPA: F0F1 ATP synthase subunit epsilon [Gammaproteobacteria bacterium]|nr:F0F1 ATP synthase subunit epsilon [Gammaproteobacteria bacterium]
MTTTTVKTLRLDIVSAEQEIFSGQAEMVILSGELGELGIAPGHAPLITALKAGNIRVFLPHDIEDVFYINSGMLEVQPYNVTILADTVVRAKDIDEAAALHAREQAEKVLHDRSSEIDIARATTELAEAIAQINAVNRIKKQKQ